MIVQVVHQLQPVQQIQQPTTQQQQPQQQQSQQQQTQQQQQQAAQTSQQPIQQAESQDAQPNVTITMATSNTLTTAALSGNITATQATPLNSDGFLTSDTFHLLGAVPPQVVTLPVSPQATVAHSVPVSLLQTSTGQQNLQ